MELPLDDPKSKEDDMGVIIVDVCLMFRDATIKRSPVRVFLITSIFFDTFLLRIVCTDYSNLLLFIEMASKEEEGMDFNIFISTFLYLLEVPNGILQYL